MDYAEARAKMAEDLLAKEQADLKKKLEDSEDKFIDTAMYRIGSMNPDIDISFLEGEQESTLSRWKIRLEEEELLTYNVAVAKGDDGGEVSSMAAPKDDASISAEIDALLAEDTNDAPKEQTPAPAEANLLEPVPTEIKPEVAKPTQP